MTTCSVFCSSSSTLLLTRQLRCRRQRCDRDVFPSASAACSARRSAGGGAQSLLLCKHFGLSLRVERTLFNRNPGAERAAGVTKVVSRLPSLHVHSNGGLTRGLDRLRRNANIRASRLGNIS